MRHQTGDELPHSPEIERAVLGAILLDVAETNEALLRLEVRDFFDSRHAIIYHRLKEQVDGGKRPDLIELNDTLATHGEIEKIGGGVGYLSSLLDGIPRFCPLLSWTDILRQKAMLRQRARIASDILGLIQGGNGNSVDVLRQIDSLSAHLKVTVGQKGILTFRSGAEFAVSTAGEIAWIAQGYVAKGCITELGAKVKMGKTTFILNLVRAAADGLNFLDKPTLKTHTVYLSEQPAVSFRQAMMRAGLLGRDDVHILLHSESRMMPWLEIAAAAVDECKRVGSLLLVVDTLPQFAGLVGDSENNAGDALAAMQPLQRAASEGIAVVIVRHERKSGGEVGDSGRGSSAFAGAVDIVLSLRRPEGHSRKTVRLLQALSRFSETPLELLVDLTEGGYVGLGEPHEAALKEAKNSILRSAPKGETEATDLKDLAMKTEISRATAQRAIAELLEENKLCRIGDGKKGNPFRYFKPEMPFCSTSDVYEQKEMIQDQDGAN